MKPEENIAKLVERLLPASVDWLVARGYVLRVDIDGEAGIQVTNAGLRYFAHVDRKNRKTESTER